MVKFSARGEAPPWGRIKVTTSQHSGADVGADVGAVVIGADVGLAVGLADSTHSMVGIVQTLVFVPETH